MDWKWISIYQPIEGIVFEKYEMFYDFMPNIDSKNLTTEFLRFAENLFTKGKADPNHRPSIKSCLVEFPELSIQKMVSKFK